MRKVIYFAVLVFFTVGCGTKRAQAQFIGYTSPQTVEQTLFASAAIGGGISATVTNAGQSVHFASYFTTGGPQSLRVYFEGSWDGSTFSIISDVSTNPAAGAVFAFGFFPVVRLTANNLLGGVSPTITATYAGTSVSNPPFGFLEQSLYRKLVLQAQPANANQSILLSTPYGNSSGQVCANYAATGPAGSTIIVSSSDNFLPIAQIAGPFTLATATTTQCFLIVSVPTTQVTLTYTSGGASATTLSVAYIFNKPGAGQTQVQGLIQPAVLQNSETTSAANTPITKSVAAQNGERVYLFSVSARCSAGTSTLTVKDGVGGTVIWTTAATEVGTTTFRFQWSPGLASSPGNGMDIVLGTCGASNTGTLDVQASQL